MRRSGVAVLTLGALLAFAGNSLLARMALADGTTGPWVFTGVRLLAGAAALAILLWHPPAPGRWPGSWPAAAALATYALAFSLAYVRLPAGIGALVLFAAVQATMLGWTTARGAAPSGRALAGMAIAASGLVWLLAPGADAGVSPGAAALMATAGGAWGIYSLLGRGVADAARATAGNFVRIAPVAAAAGLIGLSQGTWDGRGLALAVASGAVTSGLGYIVWYRAVPLLSVAQAGIVQLAVPAFAALGGMLLLGEPATPRSLAAESLTLLGVAVAVLARARR